MKLNSSKVWQMVSGVACILLGLILSVSLLVLSLEVPSFKWSTLKVLILGGTMLVPTIVGLFFLIPLCEETQEDRDYAEEYRIIKDFYDRLLEEEVEREWPA